MVCFIQNKNEVAFAFWMIIPLREIKKIKTYMNHYIAINLNY